MVHFMKRSAMAAVLGLAAVAGPAEAGLVLSVEAPGVQASTVSGVTTETFNFNNTGNYTSLNTRVGTLTSPGLAIDAANQYGGAATATLTGGSNNYFAIGAESGQTTASLALNGPQSYFGFWWSAADPLNGVQLYSKGNLLATLNTNVALAALNSSYLGNPNSGADASEPFAYLNFTATGGTTFDQVVFNNANLSTGVEADNFSVLKSATGVSGTLINNGLTFAVPEPSSLALATLGGAIGLGAARLRRRRRAGIAA